MPSRWKMPTRGCAIWPRTIRLTELPNRLLLDDRLAQAITYAERREGCIAVLVLDLDRFKMINDSLGHHGGDELLKEVANRLRGTLRKSDTLARTGGDEFVLIADEVNGQADIEILAQRLLACFAKPFHILSVDIHTAPSIGISVYPKDGARPEELVVAADAAMYHSKKVGGNTFSFFTSSMNAFAQQRLELENGLRRALGNGELELHYQPKVDVRLRPYQQHRSLDPLASSGTRAGGRAISFRWPKRPDSSCRSANGCCARLAGRRGSGRSTAWRRCASPSTCRPSSSGRRIW